MVSLHPTLTLTLTLPLTMTLPMTLTLTLALTLALIPMMAYWGESATLEPSKSEPCSCLSRC